MKVYSAAPDGNESADIEPARYFNLAIKNIAESEEWMRDANQAAQPLLVHIDIFLLLSTKYPGMAIRRKRKLDIPQIKDTFYKWYERCNKKIPKDFREGIKQSADELFEELEKIGSKS